MSEKKLIYSIEKGYIKKSYAFTGYPSSEWVLFELI